MGRITTAAKDKARTSDDLDLFKAEIPFDWILAEVTGKRGPYEFILSEPARCPNCKAEISEKTLVEPKD
jgi:hypothetical protein